MDIAINRINTYSVDKYRETNCTSYPVDGNLSNKSWALSTFYWKTGAKEKDKKNNSWFVKVVSLTLLFSFRREIWEYDSKIPI